MYNTIVCPITFYYKYVFLNADVDLKISMNVTITSVDQLDSCLYFSYYGPFMAHR